MPSWSGTHQVYYATEGSRIRRHKGNSLKFLANNGDGLSKPSTPYIGDEPPYRLSHNHWAHRLAGRDGHTPSISIPARVPYRGICGAGLAGDCRGASGPCGRDRGASGAMCSGVKVSSISALFAWSWACGRRTPAGPGTWPEGWSKAQKEADADRQR
jgi:hypothetical protein